jgi:hypothetical protein
MRQMLALAFFIGTTLFAQSNPQSLRVVLPATPGSVNVSLSGGWKIDKFMLYVDGMHGSSPIYRPVLLTSNEGSKITASYILFANDTKAPTAEGCRDADRGSIDAAKKFAKDHGDMISELKESIYTSLTGRQFPISSHIVEGKQLGSQHIFDLHAYIGDTSNCATLHLSKVQYQPTDEKLFDSLIDSFDEAYEKEFVPTAADYTALANLLTEEKQPRLAAVYVDRAVSSGGGGLKSDIPRTDAQPFTFAFAAHPGYLQLELTGYAITELSAKPNGNEFGIRAKSKNENVAALGFLYLPAEKPPLTSETCMQAQLRSEMKAIQDQAGYRKFSGKQVIKTPSGLDIAVAEYEPTGKAPRRVGYTARFFVAANDVCADISFDGANPITPAFLDEVSRAIRFDPKHAPNFFDKFRYATVLYDHGSFAAAAPIFEGALSQVSTVDDATKWRRVVTDQASMSYGMAGDLKRSRAINESAIQQDPTHPLYYYNLACADAEAGDATAARTHLQQANDRRNNVLNGETLPDPSKDSSILKLRNDKDFWQFVQSLHAK